MPTDFSLNQNYPNPFNPTTNISFGIPKDAKVKLEVFNTIGQQVATLIDAPLEAGYHTASFNADNLPSGLYIARISAGTFTSAKKMMLIR